MDFESEVPYFQILSYKHIYPLVNIQKAIENEPVEIVDFPINSMVIFPSVMLNYQRVIVRTSAAKIGLSQLLWEARHPKSKR